MIVCQLIIMLGGHHPHLLTELEKFHTLGIHLPETHMPSTLRKNELTWQPSVQHHIQNLPVASPRQPVLSSPPLLTVECLDLTEDTMSFTSDEHPFKFNPHVHATTSTINITGGFIHKGVNHQLQLTDQEDFTEDIFLQQPSSFPQAAKIVDLTGDIFSM